MRSSTKAVPRSRLRCGYGLERLDLPSSYQFPMQSRQGAKLQGLPHVHRLVVCWADAEDLRPQSETYFVWLYRSAGLGANA